MYDYLLSLVRTVASLLAGWLIAHAVAVGVDIDGTTVVATLTAGFATAYYLVFRWAELHISPRFGWLLGIAAPPKYTGGSTRVYGLLLSLVRTVAPIAAGWLIAQAARFGLHLDGPTVVSALTSDFAAAYYVVFRWAELRVSPRFGWLLGYAAPPQYADAPAH
ncbi:hypothetical protein BX257_4033 [Streptomyces sp. 3212.3]|uniref:hypothetical protein n=1 Tax=Streptomyces sp. 3212.3 TaxID=1938846 RepID=UPI000E3A9CF9|nr:hypothetical protein [Streptomyces sp. 3212.3]REE61455.1 hypothetical protein BX257_4033 [Streptomyces sp. 3212.3]